MLEIKYIRVENLRYLLEQNGGNRMAIAKKIGYKDVNYFNQLCAGIGSFGRNTAVRIERAFKLEHGWMDVLQTSTQPMLTKDENTLLTMYRGLTKKDKVKAVTFLDILSTNVNETKADDTVTNAEFGRKQKQSK